MAGKKGGSSVIRILEKDHAEMLKISEKLEQIFVNLCYEGKPSFGKNVGEAQRTLKLLKPMLLGHLALEEKVLFPLAAERTPRLKSMVLFSRLEHQEFREQLKTIEFMLAGLLRSKDGLRRFESVEKIRDVGVYLVCLLRSHAEVVTKAERILAAVP